MTEEATPPAPVERMNMHPIRLVVADDLKRSRLSVFFRFLLAYPQLWWVAIWGIAALFAVVGQWFYLLFTGRPAEGLHRFLSRYQRQYAHVLAYFNLLANPYPHFSGLAGDYPVDLEIDGPAPQARWKTLLRIILVIPAYVLSYIFQYLGLIVSVLMWIVGVIMGRVPRGLRDFNAYLVRYQLQTSAYLLLLTDRYPALSTPSPKGPVQVVPPPRPTLTGEYV